MIFWGALFLLMIVMESITAQLIAVWFAAGGLAALITSFFTEAIWIQLLVFCVVSALLLLTTRPLIKRLLPKKQEATNADSAIGKEGVVLQAIEPPLYQGRVKVEGLSWAARGTQGQTMAEGELITVTAMEGVTLLVEKKEAELIQAE